MKQYDIGPDILDNVEILAELERQAYMEGQIDKALLIRQIIELTEDNQRLNRQIEDTETLEDWEKRNGPAYEYVQFFNQCFERLSGHYPCPSVTSDYDKSVIFDAIEKGEGVE